MNKTYTLFILLCFFQYLPAQNTNYRQFGDISQEEIDMEYCSFDKTANAVVLFDIGKSDFISGYDDFDIRFTRHSRIKIFNEQGFGSGEITIPYYAKIDGEEEKIESIEAYTYIVNDGRIQKHKLDLTTVYTERINQWWKQKKFVFPGLKEGAIIEYKYILRTPFIFNLQDWEFQTRIPTLYSQYQVGMIPFYEYVYLSQGNRSLDFQESIKSKKEYSFKGVDYKILEHTYAMKNVEAFKDEAYITSINDYIMKIDFQLAKVYNLDGTSREVIPTWYKLNKDLLASDQFGKYIKNCKRYAKKALEVIDTTNQTPKQKIETLVKYVKQSFRWDGYSGKFASQSAKRFYTSKSGNVAEINLFLVALLLEAGFKAEPMIISTRSHGKLTLKYPISKKFNYVLVYLDDYGIITDATSPHADFMMIPTQCINDYGLVVNKNKECDWIQIEFSKYSVNSSSLDINIKPDKGTCEISAILKTDFFEAFNYRAEFRDDTSEIKKRFKTNFDNIYNIETKYYDQPEKPYLISFNAEKELSQINNYILIEPFFGLPPSENILKQDTRDYPVDMHYPKDYQYNISINLPEGYTIDKIPVSFVTNNGLLLISFNTVMDHKNNRLKVMGEYIFKKAVYSKEDYNLLKYHIDTIVEKFNTELVIREKIDVEG